jgi:dUTP pyrophosphatase
VALPPGSAGLVVPRSGLAARHGIALVNAHGVIDAGYRGELRVLLLNTDREESFPVAPGDRIRTAARRARRPALAGRRCRARPSERGHGGSAQRALRNRRYWM